MLFWTSPRINSTEHREQIRFWDSEMYIILFRRYSTTMKASLPLISSLLLLVLHGSQAGVEEGCKLLYDRYNCGSSAGCRDGFRVPSVCGSVIQRLQEAATSTTTTTTTTTSMFVMLICVLVLTYSVSHLNTLE